MLSGHSVLMKILVISDLPDFTMGGAEIQTARLIKIWADAGHDVICLGRRIGSSQVRVGEHIIETARIRTISSLGRPLTALSYFASLAYLMFRYGKWANIIYCRFLGDAAVSISIFKALRCLSLPLVSTPAGAGAFGDIAYLRSVPFSERLITLLDRHCETINLIAPRMEHDLREAGFKHAPLTHIPNGIDVNSLSRHGRKGPLRAICVGRLVPQKGYDILIRALASGPLLQSRLIVDIVGDGPERDALVSLAESMGVSSMIQFVGKKSAIEVRQHLLDADLFILPSRFEGMSNAALEAMEAGLPLVITHCGGLDEYLDETMSWVIPVEDHVALTKALVSAAMRPRVELVEMGASCRALIERNFDIRVTAAQYLKLFSKLINESHSHHS
jgi:glycosyltransferase involved in cell wall biosynthesis